MNLRRTFKRIVWATVLVLIGAAAALYILASHVPSDYRPSQLPQEMRESSAKKFAAKAVEQYWQKAQTPEPFTITFTQDELNAYLASLDEIAAQTPQGRHGGIRSLMESSGLSDPAVALDKGRVTLMILLKEPAKILSLDLTFDFLPDGRMRVGHSQLRLGGLPIPDSLVRQYLADFQQSLTAHHPPGAPTRASSGDMELVMDLPAVLGRVLAAMDGEPLTTDLPQRINGRVVRLIGIDVSGDALTLRIQPVSRPPAAPPVVYDGVHVP